MEILQLPILALQERIEQELNENPVLEMTEEDPNLPDEPEDRANPDSPTEDEKPLVVTEQGDNKDDFERLLNLDREVPDYFDESPRRSANRIDEEGDRQHDAMANLTARPPSLQDHLLDQLREMETDAEVARIAERIISTLDAADGGYFRSSLQDLLPPTAGPETLALAQCALRCVHRMEPKGVGARDLRECLLLQLRPDMPFRDEMEAIIRGHLEDLRDNRLHVIERATGISIPRIYETWTRIRKLNPKPASEFVDTFVPTITPDLFVERGEDGVYRIRMPDHRLPTLFISDFYRKRLADGTATAEEKEFLKRKINSAQWLIESIEQRRNTLMKVAQSIVDYQSKFLEDGPEFIEPLKMQQIAEKVGVHVTTVSRAVDDKWIQTPRGIYPLKRFFVGGTRSDEGEDVAWDRIRIKLRELVDHEDKRNPLSDDDLVRKLKEAGLNVARRTITKYRQKMNIPSSRQRKQWIDDPASSASPVSPIAATGSQGDFERQGDANGGAERESP